MSDTPETKPQDNNAASSFKHPMMAEMDGEPTAEKNSHKKLTLWQIILQAVSLLWALQDMKKFAEASDQMERSMLPVILAGVFSMAMFIGLCVFASQMVLRSVGQ
jgi:CO dehydrogenase/acetyl-CoA synthase gamma subunit (corrinoid Fe-S protein)